MCTDFYDENGDCLASCPSTRASLTENNKKYCVPCPTRCASCSAVEVTAADLSAYKDLITIEGKNFDRVCATCAVSYYKNE